MNILTVKQFQLVVEKCNGAAIDAIWAMLDPIHQGWTNFPQENVGDFSSRRETFLWTLERLLHDGFVKLHKRGVFFDTPISEQTAMFRNAFPTSEKDADERCTKPGYEPAYEGFGMNVWWFLDICPAGVAWHQPDGSYLIAD